MSGSGIDADGRFFSPDKAMAINAENRKSVRRQVYIRAKLIGRDQTTPLDCAVLDISEGGARLGVRAAQDVPQEFTLVLGANGHPYRRCRVVWRKDAHVGVVFDRTLASRLLECEPDPVAEN